MCGFVGIFRPSGLTDDDVHHLPLMRDRLIHRGPDDEGIWTDRAAGIGLGHRRLSILDLSEAGAQPMTSPSGRYVIAYNGEIYNFLEIRKELESANLAPAWRGHSDTEVLLAAFEAWGIGKTLHRCRGMFALALWDRETRKLILARDAIGEKPLYAGIVKGLVVFGSELKSVTAHPGLDLAINRNAAALCLRHGYIPAPHSIYEAVIKLLPGEYVEIDTSDPSLANWQRHAYFDTIREAQEARANRFSGSPEDAASELDELLRKVIERQMIADVPVGAFLSGGVDSSTTAAIMQDLATRPVETFSLGFNEEAVNEAPHAKAVATHLGTNHNEIYLAADEARDLVTQMPEVYDEPFADQSQLPTYLISRFARTKVTVSLSGDGADELFGGYGRYHSLRRKWGGSLLGQVTKSAQKSYAQALAGLAATFQALGIQSIAGQNVVSMQVRHSEKAARFGTKSPIAAYERGFTLLDQTHLFVKGAMPQTDPLVGKIASEGGWSVLEQASTLDTMRYLPDDILVKVDRAAMAHSLESRAPFVDPDVVRFALSLSDDIKMPGGESKGVLKSVLERYVPRPLWDRPKQGFGIPSADWLSGPLRELAADLFSKDTIEKVGVLEPAMVSTFWNDFTKGNRRRANLVWALFVVQLYLHHHQKA